MSFPGEYRVEWMSPEETYMHLENTGSKIYRGLVETVGIKKSAGKNKLVVVVVVVTFFLNFIIVHPALTSI